MNRPRLENFKAEFECEGPLSQYMSYTYMLEKYCDELEIKIKLKEHQRQNWEHDYNGIESYYKDCLAQREKVLIEWSDECHEAWCELDKYKRALDKACEFLEVNCWSNNWKEWLMRDE